MRLAKPAKGTARKATRSARRKIERVERPFLDQLRQIRNECGPDHKRGFIRKVHRMARRIDDEMRDEARRYEASREAR